MSGSRSARSASFPGRCAQKPYCLDDYGQLMRLNFTLLPLALVISGSLYAQCGKLNDGLVHLPPNWDNFTPPATGQSYVDPAFGCTVKRITNGSIEETLWDGKAPSLMNFYSTLTAMNATDTLLLVGDNVGGWRIRDINGAQIVPS